MHLSLFIPDLALAIIKVKYEEKKKKKKKEPHNISIIYVPCTKQQQSL